jgi:hypothetical protein
MPLDWQILWMRNEHPRDKHLVFHEPSHTYYIDGDSTGVTSVTSLLHCFFPHFEPDIIIDKMMKSPKWKENKYYGKTKEEIKALWNENGRVASEAGTKMHLAIEMYLNDAGHLIPEEVLATPEWKYFMKFWKDHGDDLEPWRLEFEVWVKEIKLAGSIDAVFRRKSDGKYLIYDWKRSKEIKTENSFESGYAPLDHLPNTNYWHYTAQLNVYRYILENYYDMEVADMYLVIMHPDNKSYKRMRLNRMDDEVELMVEARKKAVEAGCKKVVILDSDSTH